MPTYGRVNWRNFPDRSTPITAENLNRMDQEIEYIETSGAIAQQIMSNGGLSILEKDSGYGPYTGFALENFELRHSANNGVGLVRTSNGANMFVIDMWDVGIRLGPITAGPNYDKTIYCRVAGQYAEGVGAILYSRYTNGVLENEYSISANDFGTISFDYYDSSRNANKYIMYLAKIYKA